MLSTYGLRTEHLINPLGLDNKSPRISWKIKSEARNVIQSAYQVQASASETFDPILWDSGKVAGRSQRVVYSGSELKSAVRIFWRVKIWDNDGNESAFSEPAFFEMGLLNAADWKAKWIEPEGEVDPDVYKPAPYIRKEFNVRSGLVSARAYMTARGLYKFYVNGKEGTDHLFTPGFTSYYARLQYQVYDVTSLLNEGANAWGILLSDGWWRGSTGVLGLKNNFGYKVAFLGQLVLTYDDGSQEIIASDGSFTTSSGPLLKSDLKAGEVYDARIDFEGWNTAGFNDADWTAVHVKDYGTDHLVASSLPVRTREKFTPRIIETPNGETVLDFGQNIAGWVEMKLQGDAGTEVILVHGETLDKNGNFTLSNLEHAGPVNDFQEIHYILAGQEEEIYRPYFAIFGFRYVLLKNVPDKPKADQFTAFAIYSDMEESGDFTCSNPLINQLVSNSRWSMKSNFMEIPTDCPTRERAGWTGDAQLFSRTAADFMNVYAFYEKWLADLAAEQFPSGAVGSTVPNVLGLHSMDEYERVERNSDNQMMALFASTKPGDPGYFDGSSGWGDAAVIAPWTMYLCYGDKSILDRQYDSAKAWVDYMKACAEDRNENCTDAAYYHNDTDGELDANFVWDTKFHWGEWLEADKSHSNEQIGAEFQARAVTGDPLTATAYYGYSTRLLSQMAAILGKQEDAERYSKLYEKIKRVYNKYFIRENGLLQEGRQAPHVRALAFDLVNEDRKQAIADRLAELVIAQDYHLNTGFLSTPFILHVLAEHGYPEVAYRLLEQDTCPSWLYAVTQGATTIWESWNGISPEGELAYSLNHYSYGAVCNFLFAGVAGIRPVPEQPGYEHFIIKPWIGGTLTHASATYESPYGKIESGWRKTDDGVDYRFVVPANTTATVMIEGSKEEVKRLSVDFEHVSYKDGHVICEVGSGSYHIKL
ncbi:family 78 glycoside hydrolase catalytic domain [Paenibacillus macerans]|uniref:family 78 glycoside hydrolase catalytic domain n=1 Tax=Paenibacillus macerans TaxID=44252 RepID=UPI002E1D1923|nr:family 78 glycoside hydrolase catalytic domain [Paenibacillus macerans]